MSSEVPKDWPIIAIGSLARVKRGASPRPIKDPKWFCDEGHGWVRISDVTASDRVLRETTQYLSDEGRAASVEIVPGDLIMSICGTIGRPLFSGIHACIHDGFVAFKEIDAARLDPSYLYFVLQAQTRHFEAQSQPGTQRNLNSALVGKTEIPLPPLDEQRRIAEVLRSVDEAIAAKQAALTSSKLFKRTCREAAVARFQDHAPSRLQSVLATIDAGWSPDCESEPAHDGEWSILKTSAVVWEGYDDGENKRLPAHLEPRPHLEVVADDILITRAGPAERTGVIAIVRETAGRRMLSDKIIRLRVDREKAVPLAIAELLSSEHVQAELIRSKSGMAASQTNISQKIVLGLEMHLPPLSEQQDFAEEMAALQDAIETGEADLQTARELKAALMSDLLSGHVRVPA